MITGTGVDIIEIERIQKAIDRWGQNFLDHVFHQNEIEYAQRHKSPTQHYAVRFAAKEAVFKAVGNQPDLGWKDIQVLNDKYGRPQCTVTKNNFSDTIHLSLSHSKYYAVASAIIEKKK